MWCYYLLGDVGLFGDSFVVLFVIESVICKGIICKCFFWRICIEWKCVQWNGIDCRYKGYGILGVIFFINVIVNQVVGKVWVYDDVWCVRIWIVFLLVYYVCLDVVG